MAVSAPVFGSVFSFLSLHSDLALSSLFYNFLFFCLFHNLPYCLPTAKCMGCLLLLRKYHCEVREPVDCPLHFQPAHLHEPCWNKYSRSPAGWQRQVEMRQPNSRVAPRADQKISCFQKKPPFGNIELRAAEELRSCWFNYSVGRFFNFSVSINVYIYFFNLSFFPTENKKKRMNYKKA